MTTRAQIKAIRKVTASGGLVPVTVRVRWPHEAPDGGKVSTWHVTPGIAAQLTRRGDIVMTWGDDDEHTGTTESDT